MIVLLYSLCIEIHFEFKEVRMFSKSIRALINKHIAHNSTRCFGTMATQYSGMVNIVNACQVETKELSKCLMESNACAIFDAIEGQLKILITYHSLKMTDGFSLTLEDITYLLKESKTLENKDFFEQLKVFNFHRILDYCWQYQKELKEAGWVESSSPWKDAPDEHILFALGRLAQKLVLMFHEGLGGHFDVMYGSVQPAGSLYFFDRPEYDYVKKGLELILQTIKQRNDDPFINAAKIHNEFAKGHQFDKKFGLLFCRIHMNFALMLAGYSPAVIDSSHKEEYLNIVNENKLDDPKPLATFLVRNLKNTYQDYILPNLEAEALNKSIQIPFKLGRQRSNVIANHAQDQIEEDHSVENKH